RATVGGGATISRNAARSASDTATGPRTGAQPASRIAAISGDHHTRRVPDITGSPSSDGGRARPVVAGRAPLVGQKTSKWSILSLALSPTYETSVCGPHLKIWVSGRPMWVSTPTHWLPVRLLPELVWSRATLTWREFLPAVESSSGGLGANPASANAQKWPSAQPPAADAGPAGGSADA